MPDVQDPDCLADFIHFVEDAMSVFTIAKEKASDLPPRFSHFTSQGAPIGKLFQRIQTVKEFLEPRGPSDRGSLYNPIIDLVCIVLRRFSEKDLVSHAFLETLFQIVSVALHVRLRRLRVRA